jgi:integrase/recombinase XerC
MKTKKRLGQLFLKKFRKRSTTRTQPFHVSPSERKILRLSQMQGRIETPSQKPPTVLVHDVSIPIQTLEPIVTVVPPELPITLSPQFLSTQDLIRPQDPLRNSIEAFLIDQRSPHTRRAYGKDLKRFVKFLLARNHQQGIENLNRMVLISYKESLLSEKLEHTTVDRHLATLRSFFKWLVDDGLLDKSPADGVRFMNPKRISRTNGFTDAEVRQLLALPNLHTRTGSLHYAILMVLFHCGLRRSELCDLKTSNIGVERNQRVLRLRGKGNAERLIVLLIPVWNAIRHYFYISHRNFEMDEYLFTPIRNNRTGILKKPLDTSTIYYLVTQYAKKAGITNRVSPHSCRATAISNARDHHVPDRAIQEFAGWSSPDMITRYDKRKTSVTDSAAHGIFYGETERTLPTSTTPSEASIVSEEKRPETEVSSLLLDP